MLEHLFYGFPVNLSARKPFGRNAPSVEDQVAAVADAVSHDVQSRSS